MAVQTSLFTEDDRETMRATERAAAADIERIHAETSAAWDHALDRAPAIVQGISRPCPACHQRETCDPLCEANRAR